MESPRVPHGAERRGALRAALTPSLPPQFWRRFLDGGGRAEWLATPDAALGARLARCLGVPPPEGAALARRLAATEPDAERRAARELGARIDAWDDAAYPAPVRHLHDPPPVLFRRGRGRPADGDAVAVVGSRAATPYGQRVGHALAYGLARAGVTVVAPLDRGVATAVHAGALRAGGRSIAVLARGLRVPRAPEEGDLLARVAAAGLVVSEFPLDADAGRDHFVRRNRLVAALARGIVVVEAHERSGALGTVRFALDLGRAVMAVPGPVDQPSAHGPLRLLQEGATPVGAVHDVFTALGWCAIPKKELPARERDALAAVERCPGAATAADVADELGLLEDQAAEALFSLEARRLVRRTEDGGFATA